MVLALIVMALVFLSEPWSILVVAGLVAFEAVEIWFFVRWTSRRRILAGAEALLGRQAEVVEGCDPEGRARLGNELWRARATRPLAPGEPARVAALDGLTLVLEPDPQRRPAAPGPRAPGN